MSAQAHTAALKKQTRRERFYRDGEPRYIRIYDGGPELIDRYTVVFTGNYRRGPRDELIYLGMNECPFQGFGQHGFSQRLIDRPGYSHLGKKMKYADLSDDCKRAVRNDYDAIWRL